jgi:secondary thiamine-phosphate synthase enzyme
MISQNKIAIKTKGRGSYEITAQISNCVKESGVIIGLCQIFIKHTSASLILCENADPTVRRDLEQYMAQLVVDGDPMFKHANEGIDDMSAHIRTILTHSELTIPITENRCALGMWQGIYLWEHRTQGHNRDLTITIYGE